MDLREVLDGYVVTAVPDRDALLSLVWSEADAPVEDETDGPLTLAILDDYRITRVPKAS